MYLLSMQESHNFLISLLSGLLMMTTSGGSLSCLSSAVKVCSKSLHLSSSSITELEKRFLVERSSSTMMSIPSLSLETSITLTLDAYPSFLYQSLI